MLIGWRRSPEARAAASRDLFPDLRAQSAIEKGNVVTSRVVGGFRVRFNGFRVDFLGFRVDFVDIRVDFGAFRCLFRAFR